MENDSIKFDLGDIKPLRDRIADTIRELITNGKILPGERLSEPELSTRLGVSRTPLREAMFQLESEGFVKVTPRRGAVVSDLSAKDASDIYVAKGALEGLAARLATPNINAEIIQRLKELNLKLKEMSQSHSTDYPVILQINSEFHRLINEHSGNPKLTQLISILRKQTLRYNYIYLSVLSHLNESIDEHQQIVDALERKDTHVVERLVIAHSETACKSLCTYIETQSHSPSNTGQK
jgi:DNA-binding GntR family transcriptional regulator